MTEGKCAHQSVKSDECLSIFITLTAKTDFTRETIKTTAPPEYRFAHVTSLLSTQKVHYSEKHQWMHFYWQWLTCSCSSIISLCYFVLDKRRGDVGCFKGRLYTAHALAGLLSLLIKNSA